MCNEQCNFATASMKNRERETCPIYLAHFLRVHVYVCVFITPPQLGAKLRPGRRVSEELGLVLLLAIPVCLDFAGGTIFVIALKEWRE